jgi:hypothetical protein
MLEMRPNCESCNCELPAESTEARICSYECTFCASCASNWLEGQCPNCGGELLPRPRRSLIKQQILTAPGEQKTPPAVSDATDPES